MVFSQISFTDAGEVSDGIVYFGRHKSRVVFADDAPCTRTDNHVGRALSLCAMGLTDSIISAAWAKPLTHLPRRTRSSRCSSRAVMGAENLRTEPITAAI